MKHLNNLLFIVLLFLVQGVNATTLKHSTSNLGGEASRQIRKVFGVNNTGTISLNNQYGEINYRTWDKNQVDIKVDIYIKARSQAQAEEIMSTISVDIEGTNDKVSAVTSIRKPKNSFFKGNTEISIDYIVYVPSHFAPTIRNQYGDVSLRDVDADVALNVQYGDISSRAINGNLDLKLSYGDASFRSVETADVRVRYGDFNVGRAAKLNLDGQYGDYDIRYAENLKINTQYDDIAIGRADHLRINGNYYEVDIDTLGVGAMDGNYSEMSTKVLLQGLSAQVNYGEITVGKVSQTVKELDLSGSYSDIKVYFATNVQATLEMETSYGGLEYPDSFDVVYSERKSTYKVVTARRGPKNGKVFTFDVSYGDIVVH